MELKKTPLYDWHISKQAKMGEFAGWDMPIQYPTGIIAEHIHTRTKASIFDICHMGQFMVSGANATQKLAKTLTHNLETLKVGKCRYGFLLTEQGTILDDLIVYRIEEEKYLLVVNAGCTNSDFETVQERVSPLKLEDLTPKQGKIDLQGPESLGVLEKLTGLNFHDLPYFSFRTIEWNNTTLIVSRTGYTGELGYELYTQREHTLAIWEKLLENENVMPAGLGARDTLRLEAGLPLYGHELNTKHTPTEAGMGAMLTSQADYVGKQGAISTPKELLIGLQAEGKRTARTDDTIRLASSPEKVIGYVTSGSYAPSINASIAFAYIEAEYINEIDENTAIIMKTARAEINAKKVDLPFYKNGTARKKLQ